MSGAYYWQITMHYEDGKTKVHPSLFLTESQAKPLAGAHMRIFSDIVKCTFKRRWIRD